MGAYGYTYKFQIDFGHAGDYSHALADVTALTETDGSLMIGFTDPFGHIAPPSRLQFKLRNDNRLLATGNTSSPYYGLLTRGTLAKITLSYAGTDYVTWQGKIQKIKPEVHPHANPDANNYIAITVECPMNQLLTAQIYPKLQTNVLVHDALTSVIKEATKNVVYPYPSSWAVVGVSLVGTARVLDQSNIFTYNPSLSTLPYVGDNSADALHTVGARSLIDDIMMAEAGGRFFWDGTGFQFQDRYYSLASALSGGALALTAADIVRGDYRSGDDLLNDVEVTYQPRQVGVVGTVIYSSERAILVGAGQTKKVTAHYRDPDIPTARIGAYDVINLVSGTDFVANSVADGSGTALTSFISASLQPAGQSTAIILTNTGVTDAWITTLQVRGTPLYTYERESVNAVDAQSIYDYGRYSKSLQYKLVEDDTTAQGIANINIIRFSRQFERWHSVTFMVSDALKLVTSTVAVGLVVSIDEQTSTKTSREYAVMGIRHEWDKSIGTHAVTYILSPIAREQYWVLDVPGYSELDTTAILAL
jgi:hypothetical protein